jgi:hypothetical protein
MQSNLFRGVLMKMVNAVCPKCGHKFEAMVSSLFSWGDDIAEECEECGHPITTIVPSCCPVRTPNNSVSFIDGHRDDGGQMSMALQKFRIEKELKRGSMDAGNLKKERIAMEGFKS